MSSFHVFGQYWKNLDETAVYSRHIKAISAMVAERTARKEIQRLNGGLGGEEIQAYVV